jgi:hypothetical protein
VEQKVLMPLLTDGPLLAISKASVHTQRYLAAAALDTAACKMTGYPDYSVWLHGLSVTIIEAKAPDVAPEEGYREASLYPRHLNQKFPSGMNRVPGFWRPTGAFSYLDSGTWHLISRCPSMNFVLAPQVWNRCSPVVRAGCSIR